MTGSPVTLDATKFTAGTNNKAGTVIGVVTASGLGAPYDDGNDPAGVGVAVGILMNDVSLADGNEAVSLLIHGRVDSSRLIGYDVAVKADLPLVIFE
jgi:hypothetical protein